MSENERNVFAIDSKIAFLDNNVFLKEHGIDSSKPTILTEKLIELWNSRDKLSVEDKWELQHIMLMVMRAYPTTELATKLDEQVGAVAMESLDTEGTDGEVENKSSVNEELLTRFKKHNINPFVLRFIEQNSWENLLDEINSAPDKTKNIIAYYVFKPLEEELIDLGPELLEGYATAESVKFFFSKYIQRLSILDAYPKLDGALYGLPGLKRLRSVGISTPNHKLASDLRESVKKKIKEWNLKPIQIIE